VASLTLELPHVYGALERAGVDALPATLDAVYFGLYLDQEHITADDVEAR
jgi:hypothetical protein